MAYATERYTLDHQVYADLVDFNHDRTYVAKVGLDGTSAQILVQNNSYL